MNDDIAVSLISVAQIGDNSLPNVNALFDVYLSRVCPVKGVTRLVDRPNQWRTTACLALDRSHAAASLYSMMHTRPELMPFVTPQPGENSGLVWGHVEESALDRDHYIATIYVV